LNIVITNPPRFIDTEKRSFLGIVSLFEARAWTVCLDLDTLKYGSSLHCGHGASERVNRLVSAYHGHLTAYRTWYQHEQPLISTKILFKKNFKPSEAQ
jgi:hypothetical protein